MTPRQRLRKALAHQEPDRVPIDFGQDFHNGIHECAYDNLRARLGISDGRPVQIYDFMQRLAVVDERVLERFRVDTRYLFANPDSSFNLVLEPDGSYEDEWGIYRKRVQYYCENVRAPLAGLTREEIARHRFPDPTTPSRFAGLRERAQALYTGTEWALMAGSAATLYYLCAELRGFEQYMTDVAFDLPLIETLLDKMLEWMLEFHRRYLSEVGGFIEGWWMGDDWGMQTGPILSPSLFRRIYKPRYKKLLEMVHAKTDAKVCLHTCGSTYWLLGDLIDVGVDVVHPLQPTAVGNGDPVRIKREFGDRLAFYSNVANTTVLPRGTPAEVAVEAERKIAALAPGGGYVFSAGHNIQADVPPDNVIALFDSAWRVGRYPIAGRL